MYRFLFPKIVTPQPEPGVDRDKVKVYLSHLYDDSGLTVEDVNEASKFEIADFKKPHMPSANGRKGTIFQKGSGSYVVPEGASENCTDVL